MEFCMKSWNGTFIEHHSVVTYKSYSKGRVWIWKSVHAVPCTHLQGGVHESQFSLCCVHPGA